MANTVTNKRLSNSVRTMLIENATTAFSGTTVMIQGQGIEAFERATIQIRNEGEAATITGKVWGTLFDVAGTVGGASWTQIGDDIAITNASSALKSISTTGLMKIGVTMVTASGTPNFTAEYCKLFLQGTI